MELNNSETQKEQVLEQIETRLFYGDKLLDFVHNIFDNMEQADFGEFVDFLEFELNNNDYNNSKKWEILKNYTSFDNLQKADFETIKKEFLQDILQCFEILK